MVELETPRLTLKPPHAGLADMVFDYFKRNQQHFATYGPERRPEWDTIDYHRDKHVEYAEKIAAGTNLWLFLFEKGNPDKIIGDIHLSNIIRSVFQSCHVGYKLDEQAQGRGYMREALQRLVQYAFEDMKLHRIEANIIPANTRSIKLVTSLGFEEEGLAKKYLKINGRWQDHVHYVILNEALE
ncbi:MAG TPA: GNAT family protein [Chitinophagales bacterium]|nr:GNAT family protein [Chitinophagales bacterium]